MTASPDFADVAPVRHQQPPRFLGSTPNFLMTRNHHISLDANHVTKNEEKKNVFVYWFTTPDLPRWPGHGTEGWIQRELVAEDLDLRAE